MITDNKYIDIAHTISLNCIFDDGSKNYIKAMLEFAEIYHKMELKKINKLHTTVANINLSKIEVI